METDPMTPRPIVYMAHPFGGDMANVEAAKEWLGVLIKSHESVDFIAPWIPMVEALGDVDADMRARGLAMDCETMRRCDGLVLVGKEITTGMRKELEAARYFSKPVVDLTGYVLTAIPESIPPVFDVTHEGQLFSLNKTPPTPEHNDAWSMFLAARHRVILDMMGDNQSFKHIATVLSMDPEQARRIAAAPFKAVAGESFASVRTIIGTTDPTTPP